MAALVLKQIERGSVSFTSSDTEKTVTLSTTLTDTSKAIILHSTRSDSGSARNWCVTGRIISTTQIRFNRVASPTIAAVLEWQVIEFTSGISVQSFYINQTSTTINTAISEIDTAKTFAIVSGAYSTLTAFGPTHSAYADITTSTNLATVVNTAGATTYVAVQVVQIDDATVQKKSDTYGTGATKDVTVTTIDPAKTFWFFGLTSSATITNENAPYLSYINSTTLRFTRADSTGTNFSFVLYVVSLSSGVAVQNISTVIAAGATTVSPAITTVTVANTAIVINGIIQEIGSLANAAAEGAYYALTLSGLTTTAFTATRAVSSATLATTTNVQVLSFSPSADVFWLIQEE